VESFLAFARTKKKSRRDGGLGFSSVRVEGAGWTEYPSWKGVLLHDQIGDAAEDEHCGDGPQQDDWHGCSPCFASKVAGERDALA
jgi:hypothetical protein